MSGRPGPRHIPPGGRRGTPVGMRERQAVSATSRVLFMSCLKTASKRGIIYSDIRTMKDAWGDRLYQWCNDGCLEGRGGVVGVEGGGVDGGEGWLAAGPWTPAMGLGVVMVYRGSETEPVGRLLCRYR